MISIFVGEAPFATDKSILGEGLHIAWAKRGEWRSSHPKIQAVQEAHILKMIYIYIYR